MKHKHEHQIQYRQVDTSKTQHTHFNNKDKEHWTLQNNFQLTSMT